MPWHIEVACVGAILMLIGYYIKSRNWLDYTKKYPILIPAFLIIGLWIDILCKGGVALASNTIRYPLAMFLCSICMTIGIIGFSEKIYRTIVGRFLNFCGRSTLIFMGFNYYLNTWMPKIWRVLPGLNKYKFTNGMFRFILVTVGLLFISLVWEKVHPYLQKLYSQSANDICKTDYTQKEVI